jgi:hypothetical protein
MNMKTAAIGLLIAVCLFPRGAFPEGEGGQVQIPLDVYQQLLQAAQQPSRAPSGFALGNAEVGIRVVESEGRARGDVTVTLSVDVLEDEWVLVPILPSGTPVSSVTLGEKAVQLIPVPDGLAWGVNKKGAYSLALRYHVDASRSQTGFVLPVPTPAAAAIRLKASLPGAGLDVALIPGAGVQTTSAEGRTTLTATVPTTRGVQLSWRAPTLEGHTISRAVYSGKLAGDAIQWTGDLGVDLSTDDSVTLELLPKNVTVTDILVDGKPAPIMVSGDTLATVVRGRGAHRVRMSFQVPVRRGDGPPRVALKTPEIPVSSFELTLPGRKEVSVTPASDVTHRTTPAGTVAKFNVPMTREVTLSWREAIPEDVKAETRANGSVFHAMHVEEGVLYIDALIALEVTRGEVSTVAFEAAPEVQINRIESENGGIADWRIVAGGPGKPQVVTVFLDHGVEGEFRFRVHYDRSLPRDDPEARIPMPLLSVHDVHRQRGMVALLATKEVALSPVEEGNVTRVGENQLPSFFRQTIEMTIAHTFKYTESRPRLVATTTIPERALAKFDAEVDTLISLTDVTMTGSAAVNVNVKSGGLETLQLVVPRDVNVFSLTAPSLRTHRTTREDDRQLIDVEFTQEMEGQFRLDVLYERITADAEDEVSVATLSVVGAEVEQGRIAVEALAAVEVKVASSDQLSSIDPAELPQQLILKTTNPILLAYKYVHPPYALALRVTRHREVDVQTAAIDKARYHTLFTRDGLAVTTARFRVRNSRKQFLRVRLPAGAEVWSATVGGKPEKPAIADHHEPGSTNGSGPEILIKVINSVQGFPVELTYATPVSDMGRFGRIGANLPRPDMVVTRSRWDVYLPDRFHYGTPITNMDLVVDADPVTSDELRAGMAGARDSAQGPQPTPPLQIQVPGSGIRYAFEKLYASQAEEDASFSIPYTSALGATLGQVVALVGTALFWVGIVFALRREGPLSGRAAIALAVLGLIVLLAPVGYLETNLTPPLVLSLMALLAAAAFYGRERWGRWISRPTLET